MTHAEAIERLEGFVRAYSKGVAFRLGYDDRTELIKDLEQSAYEAILRCPECYVELQYKVAIRYGVMQALTRWRWQVTYHGKQYVPREDPILCECFDRYVGAASAEFVAGVFEFVHLYRPKPKRRKRLKAARSSRWHHSEVTKEHLGHAMEDRKMREEYYAAA